MMMEGISRKGGSVFDIELKSAMAGSRCGISLITASKGAAEGGAELLIRSANA